MIFTVHNSSCGKVMFSLAYMSRILSTGGGGVHGRGACIVGGMCGRRHAWQGGVHGGGHGGGHAWQGDMCGGGGLSGRYTSYRNTFLLSTVIELSVICGIVVRYTLFFKVPNPMVQTRE